MPITPADIKLLASERLADTPDGGGRITGTAIQDGAENNLFDDIADLDRVTGRVSLRKGAVAVQTADTDKYLGARVMVCEIPADPATHGVLFTPTQPDDLRADAVVKLSSYLAPGGTFAGFLYGNHIAGMGSVILLQRTSSTPPVVGDVLYLVQNEGLGTQVAQYCRITAVAVALRNFEDGSGEFQRAQVTCSLSAPLAHSFGGFEALREDSTMDYTERARVRETIVADAAQYFGAKALQESAALGGLSVKVASAFAQLLPSSQVETPLANADPATPAPALVGAGTSVAYSQSVSWDVATPLALPSSPLPGTLSIQLSSGTVADQSGALRLGGVTIGAVDYTTGLCTLLSGGFYEDLAVAYQAAGRATRAPQSAGTPVTLASRALNYSLFMDPPPLRGSASVSYRAQGRWYTLADNQAGGLQGSTSGLGAGSVNYTDGFATATLGALPDVGSAVIFQWAGATQDTRWPAATLQAEHTITLPGTDAIQPGSLTVTWGTGPSAKTATSTAAGGFTGDASGTVNYASRVVTVRPTTLPPPGTVLSFAWNNSTPAQVTLTPPAPDGAGNVTLSAGGPVVPGSLRIRLVALVDESAYELYTYQQSVQMGMMPTGNSEETLTDTGTGQVLLRGAAIGTVNYTTGTVVIAATFSLTRVVPQYVPYYAGGQQWRVAFKGMNYVSVQAGINFGIAVTLNFSTTTGAAQTTTAPIALALDAVPGVSVNLVPGALHLKQGNTVVACSGTGLLRKPTPTGLLNAGTINLIGGRVALSVWDEGPNTFDRLACISALGEVTSSQYVFRTASAPIKPGSFAIRYARPGGSVQTVTAAPDGSLTATGLVGQVNYDTGVCTLDFGALVAAAGQEAELWYDPAAVTGGQIWKPAPIAASTVRYNAVAYTYLPLSDDMLGVPSVQLPQDGRVVIYKPGRVVVVHHTANTAPATVANGQTVNTGRTLLAWLRVIGSDGQEITTGFAKDLDAGTVTFTNVAGYSQPVTVRSRIETEALCLEATIDGSLRLGRQLAHNYPAGETLVSSVLLGGTLQAGVAPGFSQDAWVNQWADDPTGEPLLAQYDQSTYPIDTTNAGAITQRWAIIFTSATQFRLVGQTRGQIATGNTSTPLAPVNPFTGAPLFTIEPAGWGSGWAAGNVFRFNTTGAVLPFWVARTVEQSNPAAPGTDRLTLEARGSIDA